MNIHVEIWLAAASLHEGGRQFLTAAEIQAEIKRLFGAERPNLPSYLSAHVNAGAKATKITIYNYLVRVDRGVYRLCRLGDPVHRTRTGARLSPDQADVSVAYWPLWAKWRAWQKGAMVEAAPAAMPEQPPVQADADRVAAYAQGLESFRLERSPAGNYDHMGAIITEAILQAGIDYRSVVLPRVARLRQAYPHLRTTGEFAALLADRGPEALLDFTGEKPRRVQALTAFLRRERVETEADLRAWLGKATNRERLQELPGVGPKTVDYLQILVGIDSAAVDRHLAQFLADAGVRAATYDRRKAIIEQAAAVLGVEKATLDYSIWLYMADRSRSAAPAPAGGERSWPSAAAVQAGVVAHLESSGYTIVRVADSTSLGSGKDIIARGPDGRLRWVSVKGFPEKKPGVLARQWFAESLLDVVLFHDENASVDRAVALPAGQQAYQALVQRMAWLRGQLPFTVYWVDAACDVTEG